MTFEALTFYLNIKFEHEFVKDTYITDMLRFAAWNNVKDGEKMARYADLIKPKKEKNALKYNSQDVVDMFRGKGKLA